MVTGFDKNGNATETHTATVSSFNPGTGEFKSTYEVRILAGTGIPAYSTLTLAPVIKSGFAACWNGVEWVDVTDLRGSTAYNKSDGSAQIIKTLGELDDSLTSLEPGTPYDKWDGTQWVTDADTKHAADVAAVSQKKIALRAVADGEIDWLQDALDAGIATDDETDLLVAWKAYRVQLMRIDISKAPDIEWPSVPGEGK